jgi:glucose/arabinose dehydrogenase
VAAVSAAGATAAELPAGFQETVAIGGLKEPTAIRFSPDGRVFVAEKPGIILVYDGIGDQTPEVFADLRKQVYDTGDRGLLGLALDPGFPASPYVYALYTFDHVIGEQAPGVYPAWGQPPTYEGDPCPKPPEADVDACPVSGRLVRLQAVGNHAASESVLIEDWCQQTSSHSIGDLRFGPEGALFASGGDGAGFGNSEFGQFGWPHKNQCGDPPGSIGVALSPPTAEGGSLRAQDLRTPADPTGLDGSVIRVNPQTGEGWPGNPLASSPDPNARRTVGYGFRNPFRFAIDAQNHELYVDNVGNVTDEEIDRFSTSPTTPYNSGWPCYEGNGPNPGFQTFELNVCNSLYAAPGSTSPPFFMYVHKQPVTSGDQCISSNGSAISGATFYDGGEFPLSYGRAFFFADSVRGCIYVMFAGADGRPDPSTTTPFLTNGGLYPGVDLEVGPEGALYYAQLFGPEFGDGSIKRVDYFAGNQPPIAHLKATPQWSAGSLNAEFDAGGSTDAEGERLSYEWDPEGDGSYEAPTSNPVMFKTFSDSQNHTVAVRVADQQGATSVARVTVYPEDTPPQPQILEPAESSPGSGVAGETWGVGQALHFSGIADDAQDGRLAPVALDWSSRLYHCPGGPTSCHAHPLQAFPHTASGTLVAPEHEYPSHIGLTFTATDSRGLSASRTIEIDPRAVHLEIRSQPAGVTLTAGPLTEPAPFSLVAIEGSVTTLSAPVSTRSGGTDHAFAGWSDGGARTHTIVANRSGIYTARYGGPEPGPPGGRRRAPQTRLLKHPAKVSSSSSARFTFDANRRPVRFRCKLDRLHTRFCRSPRIYKHLRPGRHLFKVAAVDADGSADKTPATFRWRIVGTRG